MATVENVINHPISLTGGRQLGPGEVDNVDPTAANEAAWIAAGGLQVIDPDVSPPVPVNPPTTQPVLAPVVVAATGNVSSRSGTATLDGVALTAGQRVLLPLQTTASQRGVWVVQAAAWDRPTDFPSGVPITSRAVLVIQGTANANTWWQLSTAASLVVDTDSQTWAQAGGGSGGDLPSSVVVTDDASAAPTLAWTAAVDGYVLSVDKGSGKLVAIPTIQVPPSQPAGPHLTIDASGAAVFVDAVALVVTMSATPTYNTNDGTVIRITGVNTAFTNMSTNRTGTIRDNQHVWFEFTDDGSPHTINWGADFQDGNATRPTSTPGTGKKWRVGFIGNAVDSKFDCMAT